MTREKRDAWLQARVPASTKQRVARHVGKVISVSDYLYELVEKDLAQAEVMETVKQKLGGRVGRN